MRTRYDFVRMKGRKNPYARLLKQPVTIRLDRDTVAYFKAMAGETGLPYQHLINLYLRDCVAEGRRPATEWGRSSMAEPSATYRPGDRRPRKRKELDDDIAETPEYKVLLADVKALIRAAQAGGLVKPRSAKRSGGTGRARHKRKR